MVAQIIHLPNPRHLKRISIVMVSYNTGLALLEAVSNVMADPDIFELILVDNGNSRIERQRISDMANQHDRIRIVQGHGNIGFARGCNYGARLAKGDYLLFLNPDAVIKKGAARLLLNHGERLKAPWVIGAMLRDVNGHEQRGSRREELTLWRAFVTFTGLHKLPGFKSIHMEDRTVPDIPVPVDVVSGACLMMDRSSFNNLRGFDERYFLHVEDIDICRRVRQMGGQVAFHPKAEVMHYGSTSRVPMQKVEWQKFKGFMRYFWNYKRGVTNKVLTIVGAPLMMLAIMGRAWVLAFRKVIKGS